MNNQIKGSDLYEQLTKNMNKSSSLVDMIYENWKRAEIENQALKKELTELKEKSEKIPKKVK